MHVRQAQRTRVVAVGRSQVGAMAGAVSMEACCRHGHPHCDGPPDAWVQRARPPFVMLPSDHVPVWCHVTMYLHGTMLPYDHVPVCAC